MTLESILGRYGRSCSLIDTEGNVLQSMGALLSPLRYKNKMYLSGVNTRIGYNSEGHYLYIGPASPDLTSSGDERLIECDGRTYRIDRAEKVYRGDEIFYVWAVVRETVEEEEEEQ